MVIHYASFLSIELFSNILSPESQYLFSTGRRKDSASGSLCCGTAEAAFSEGGTDGLRQSGSRIAKMLKTGYPLSPSPSLLEGTVC